jgi:uncharacterized UPF0160 family protein
LKVTKISENVEYLDEIDLTEEHKTSIKFTFTFVKQILNYLPRAIPDYTDHGVQHSNNLMKIFSNFLSNQKDHFEKAFLTEEERWVICLAIWLHDIGVLVTKQEEKDKHNENSVEILDRPEFEFLKSQLGKDIVKCLKFVIKNHSSKCDLNAITKDPIHPKIRLRLICAIFRLIDGCDVTSARTKPVLYKLLRAYDLLNQDSVEYWEAHLTISSAVFKKEEIIIDCDDPTTAKKLTDHLEKEINRINLILNQERFPEFTVKIVSSTLN